MTAPPPEVWTTRRLVLRSALVGLKLLAFLLLAHTAAERFVYAGF